MKKKTVSALALMLAVLGTYSVVACVVDQRRRYMAIRVALGAAPSDIASAVLTRSLASVAVGIAAGLVVAAMVGGAAGSMLYGVGVLDPVSFAASAALLFAVALAGCTIPVWRATRVDPISVLRTD